MSEQVLTLVIVDDEQDFARGLARMVQGRFPDLESLAVSSVDEALEIVKDRTVPVVLSDLRMPGKDGFDLVHSALQIAPQVSIILITAYGSIEKAVQALKNGAYDFVTKPVDHERLFSLIQKALERYHLITENDRLRQKARVCAEHSTMIGESEAVHKLQQALAMVAQNEYTVLVQGESGTGKELAARIIHDLSDRSRHKLVTVNCPAIPDHLLESELFGHTRGAFTGAEQERQGLFKAADKGTILLDEIGDISLSIQTKLLRVLQEQEIRPVGSNRSQRVDVRIVASTNQDLGAKIQDGSFREDLYYRLNVLNIHLPPLRERKEDIPLLVHTFLHRVCQEMGIEQRSMSSEALSYLASKEWPGNVRELMNFVRRAVVFSPGQTIDLEQVRSVDQGGLELGGGQTLRPYKEAKAKVVEDFTRAYVQDVLSRAGGNVSEAARLSGLERVSLQKIMRRLNIHAE
jgi:DNA-binding NtrC family response regulator